LTRKGGARVIGVVSGKGGVGKTTTAANLGAALARNFRKKVLVVDCNFAAPDLPLYFGMYPLPAAREKIVEGRAVYPHSKNLHLLLASSIKKGKQIELKKFLRKLDYSFILLDAPPVGDELVFDLSDELLVVTNPDVSAVASAVRAIKRSGKHNLSVLGVEVNRIRKERHEVSQAELLAVFDTPIISSIPEDPNIRKALVEGDPAVLRHPRSKASTEFQKLAAHLLGKKFRAKMFRRLLGPFGGRSR